MAEQEIRDDNLHEIFHDDLHFLAKHREELDRIVKEIDNDMTRIDITIQRVEEYLRRKNDKSTT